MTLYSEGFVPEIQLFLLVGYKQSIPTYNAGFYVNDLWENAESIYFPLHICIFLKSIHLFNIILDSHCNLNYP